MCEEFSSFEYPFSKRDIFEEMMENTFFIPSKNNYIHGFTQKYLISIYISARLRHSYNIYEFSNLIIDIGHIFNTILHEQINHYIKGLLFFNSFRSDIQQNIGSDHNLQKDRSEILLYGEVLDNLKAMQALRMFYVDTYQTTIINHFKQFKNNYKEKQNKKENMRLETLNYNDIMNDNNASPFLKSIIANFYDYHKIEHNEAIMFDPNFSSKKQPLSNDIFYGEEITFYPNVSGGNRRSEFIDSLP